MSAALYVDFDNVFSGLLDMTHRPRRRSPSTPVQLAAPACHRAPGGRPPSVAGAALLHELRRVGAAPAARPSSGASSRRSVAPSSTAGFEMVDCPPLTPQKKNAADIKVAIDVVDALHGPVRRTTSSCIASSDVGLHAAAAAAAGRGPPYDAGVDVRRGRRRCTVLADRRRSTAGRPRRCCERATRPVASVLPIQPPPVGHRRPGDRARPSRRRARPAGPTARPPRGPGQGRCARTSATSSTRPAGSGTGRSDGPSRTLAPELHVRGALGQRPGPARAARGRSRPLARSDHSSCAVGGVRHDGHRTPESADVS